MESTPTVNYNELTVAEQSVVANATGWDGKVYSCPKTGIKVELVDGDVATYRVLDKGNQIAEEPKAEETPAPAAPETTETEVQSNEPAPVPPTEETAPVAPETEPTAPADEPVPSNDTESESQVATDTAPTEPETEVTPAETPATEPATTE